MVRELNFKNDVLIIFRDNINKYNVFTMISQNLKKWSFWHFSIFEIGGSAVDAAIASSLCNSVMNGKNFGYF